ncbi:MAG: hypothetical protein Q9224_003740 [Gallowayella concinna]
MATRSTPHHTPNYYNNPPSIAWKVTTTDYVTVSIAFVVVLARCYTKFVLLKSRGWDDYRMHSDSSYTTDQSQLLAVDGYLYIVAIALAKISLLLFLYRIFQVDKRFRIASWIVGAVLVIWSTVTLFLTIFACRPVKASWNLKLMKDPKTKCHPKAWDTSNIYGFCNIITDFALIVMPLPLVWRMQMNRKKKFGIAVVFASGFL